MDKYLVIVNKENKFDQSMIGQFKKVQVKDIEGSSFLEEETAKALAALSRYMAKKHLIGISKTSTHRTEEQQAETLEYFIKKDGEASAKDRVAMPGYSEHHLGLALDVGVHKLHIPAEQTLYNAPLTTKVMNRLVKSTKEEEMVMYKKLHAELAQFGFILRYPEDKKEHTMVKRDEPWHIRYVGVEHAKAMQELGMCLEEYVAYLKEQELTV